MDTTLRTIIITGANRGVGWAILKKIISDEKPYKIIMACRNMVAAKSAAQDLLKLYPFTKCEINSEKLDLESEASIDNFKDILQTKYKKFDVLFNNGCYADPKDIFQSMEKIDIPYETRDLTIKTAFTNTKHLTQKLLPLLSDDGKIIMISSFLGKLEFQGPDVRRQLEDPNIDEKTLDHIAEKYLESLKTRSQEKQGFHPGAYWISKALLNAYSRFVLRKELKETQQVYVATPGWCKTEMGTEDATHPVEHGAETPFYLLDLPFKVDQKYDAKFFEEKEITEY